MKKKLLLLIFILLLSGCGNYRELNNMAIVTGVGIDKIDDKYELSFLIANSPKSQTSSKEGEAQTTVYSAKGKTLSEASGRINYRSPKQLYFGHINVIIISEDIGKDGFFKISDYFLRHYESRKKFFLMQSKKDKPKDILKIVSPLESFPSGSIATLIKSNQETQSVVETVDYSSFIERILEKGYDPILPVITISGNKKKGEDMKNIESTEPEAFLKLNSIAIYKDDKFKGYEPFKYGQAINVMNNHNNELKTTFKYKNSHISFNSETMKSKINIKSPKEIDININGKGYLTEVNISDNIENPKTIKKMEKALNKSIKKNIEETIDLMQNKYHSDVFGFGNKIYKKYPDKWKKIEKNWDNTYFPNLKTNVKVNIIINSSGALDKTIKEVKK